MFSDIKYLDKSNMVSYNKHDITTEMAIRNSDSSTGINIALDPSRYFRTSWERVNKQSLITIVCIAFTYMPPVIYRVGFQLAAALEFSEHRLADLQKYFITI